MLCLLFLLCGLRLLSHQELVGAQIPQAVHVPVENQGMSVEPKLSVKARPVLSLMIIVVSIILMRSLLRPREAGFFQVFRHRCLGTLSELRTVLSHSTPGKTRAACPMTKAAHGVTGKKQFRYIEQCLGGEYQVYSVSIIRKSPMY